VRQMVAICMFYLGFVAAAHVDFPNQKISKRRHDDAARLRERAYWRSGGRAGLAPLWGARCYGDELPSFIEQVFG